jgi:hypothetical protein
MSSRIAMVALTLISLAGYQVTSESNSSHNGFDLVDKTGNIRKPLGCRDHYQALGTYMVLDPKRDQIRYTYAAPATTEY